MEAPATYLASSARRSLALAAIALVGALLTTSCQVILGLDEPTLEQSDARAPDGPGGEPDGSVAAPDGSAPDGSAPDGRPAVELCMDGADNDGDGDTDCDDADCNCPGTCGDGMVDRGEECDDAGESADCDTDCTAALCSDGTVNATAGEACDDAGSSALCDIDCTPAACGDGLVNPATVPPESCDDGNTFADDGCSTTCAVETGFGTGADGALVVSTVQELIVPRASANASSGLAQVAITNVSAAFSPGQKVLLHQTQADTGSVGHFEYNRILAASATNLTLERPLANSYMTGTGAAAQILVVREYTTVTVTGTGDLRAVQWNDATGGILAMDVQGEISIQAGGLMRASGAGFRGRSHQSTCPYRCSRGFQGESHRGRGEANISANSSGGGGGGAGQDGAGGGGGGHGTGGQPGGNGSCNGVCAEACPIPGGASGSAAPDNLVASALFGGAGGEGGADEDGSYPGIGGDGGGLILIRGASISVAGSIRSIGVQGANGVQNDPACPGVGSGMGGGGGGAGGAIRIEVRQSAAIGNGLITATGGAGGVPNGGAGAPGRIGIRATTVTGTSNPPFDSL